MPTNRSNPLATFVSTPYRQAFLGLASLFLLANVPLLLGLRQARWDADGFFCPAQVLVADCARAGKLLLWNPWTNAGSPDGLDPQYGALSPVNVGYGFLFGGSETAFRYYWLAGWFLSGAGMFMLARQLRAPAWGCFVASTGLVFSGFLVGHASHTSYVVAFAFLPWIIWRCEVARLSRSLLAVLQAGALCGLSALAGHPGVVFANGMFVVLWVLGRVVCDDPEQTSSAVERGSRAIRSDRQRWIGEWFRTVPADAATQIPATGRLSLRAAFLGAWLFLLTAVIVLSPTYVGFMKETRGFSNRNGDVPREVAVSGNALYPAALTTLASPLLAVSILTDRRWGDSDVTILSIYVGAILTWFAVAAPGLRPRCGWRWWLWAIGLLGLGLSLGPTLPLRGWLYDFCPPTRMFRHTGMFRGMFVFALAALTAEASRDIERLLAADRPRADAAPADRRAWRSMSQSGVFVATIALLAFAAMFLFPEHSDGVIRNRPSDYFVGGLHTVVCWSAVVLLASGWTWKRAGRPIGRELVTAVICLTIFDSALTSIVTRQLISSKRSRKNDVWAQLNARRNRSIEIRPADLARLDQPSDLGPGHQGTNRYLLVKAPVLYGYQPLENDFHLRWVRDRILSAAATRADRIWFTPRSATVQTELSARSFAIFRMRAGHLNGMPLVWQAPDAPSKPVAPDVEADIWRLKNLPPARPMPVRLTTYQPNRLEFDVVAPAAGYLLVTDRWAPGWTATVNGASVPVLIGNYIYRAVEVGTGTNRIAFHYRPYGFPGLLIASWSTLTVIGAISLVGVFRRSAPRPNVATEVRHPIRLRRPAPKRISNQFR